MAKSRIDFNTKWLFAGGIVAAFVGRLFLILSRRIPESLPPLRPSQAKANIQRPRQGETVGRYFNVSGTLGEIPESHHVWLGIEVGALLWPKEPGVPTANRRFSVEIVEGGNPPNGGFALVIFQVGPEGQKHITRWFDTGRRTGDSPGIDPRELHGFLQLDRVDDLKQS